MRQDLIKKLVAEMKKENFDAVLVCPSEELVFFAGFSPMMCKRFQGLFIKDDGSYFYLCNLLYAGEMENHLPEVKIHTWFDGDEMAEKVKEILDGEGLLGKTIGVNSSTPAFSILDIAEKTGIKFKSAKAILEEMRIIKTDEEIENLRKASSITDQVFTDLISFIKPKMQEGEIKNYIFSQMEKYGGTKPWALVARGVNSSFPHYRGTDGVIEAQDVVLLDFGCTYNEMCADMSRMIFVGGITDEQKKIYNICREATEAAQAACFEGAFIPDVDKVCRDIITQAGYGEYFVNRTGHGIGYMGHEAPDIKGSNPRKLEKGMCFSIEPGINLTDKFGMRVENIIAITDKGAESLNKSTHEIVII